MPLATRLDWGFGNPNDTAALIATLMVAIWLLPCLHRQLFWLALFLFTGLGGCLMRTASRGGIVAVAIGLGILLVRTPRPWLRSWVISSIVSLWVVIGLAAWLPTLHRFSKGISGQDLSITQRLELWRAAPRMMVDAPGGWGFGNAANAFQQWYQPLDQSQVFLSLINSHLTWLVEIGWAWRFLYVFGWLVVLALCWTQKTPQQSPDWMIIPFTVWVVFAVTAWFSSVADSPWIWVVPVVVLVPVLAWRGSNRRWLCAQTWGILALTACFVLGIFLVLGSTQSGQPRLRLTGSRIVLGNTANPDVWIIMNSDILGKKYGRTLRQYWQTSVNPKSAKVLTVAVVQSVDQLTSTNVRGATVVAAGTLTPRNLVRLKELMPVCAKTILLNPTFYPQDMSLGSLSTSRVEVVSGEFSQAQSTAWGDTLKQPVHNIEGAGDFLPRWPELVLSNIQLHLNEKH